MPESKLVRCILAVRLVSEIHTSELHQRVLDHCLSLQSFATRASGTNTVKGLRFEEPYKKRKNVGALEPIHIELRRAYETT